MKVLYEMMYLIESKQELSLGQMVGEGDQIAANTSENQVLQFLINESNLLIQIFVDLAIFISKVVTADQRPNKEMIEKFQQGLVWLFEMYLFKTQSSCQMEILLKSVDFIMARI